MAKTQSLECVRFYHYGLEIHTYVPGCSEKRRLGGKKNSEWVLVGYFKLRSHVDTLEGNETRKKKRDEKR